MTGDPSLIAAVHPTVIVPSPRLTMWMFVGACGLTSGRTTLEAADGGESPTALKATTVKV